MTQSGPRPSRIDFEPFTGRLPAALGGRYVLQRELGRGGMATVYLAVDDRHSRHVAVKVLRPELIDSVLADRFLREIEFAAGLTHPHILPVYDSGVAPDILYYVMPYVDGESLHDRTQRERRLSVEDALTLALEIAGALGFAHRSGVIHRDIKPENILLIEGHAMVADFGIARAIGAKQKTETSLRLTDQGLAVGTPLYMSPEQAAAEQDIDGRSDIYSLGCVLYEMLAGEPPFRGTTALAVAAQHLRRPPPSVRVARPDVPAMLDAAILRSLAKSPTLRFSTAEDFAAELRMIRPIRSRRGGPRLQLPETSRVLVGREEDLLHIAESLEQSQLVTILGPGGVGKTRIAAEATVRLSDLYRDGAFFVSLGAVTSSEQLVSTLGEALRLPFDSGRNPLEQLIDYIRDKQMLVVLDNFEQLLDEAALVARIVGAASGIRLLVTSRERLNLSAETVVELSGLSGAGRDGADAAVRLFADRAVEADPTFELTDETRATVLEVCERVGGLPLGIELAAAMLRVVSCRELVDEMRTSLEFIATPLRDVAPRHRSLLALFESTWQRLDATERAVLMRLAILRGRFTRDAALHIAGASISMLLTLVDKSLVYRAGPGRYTMHEVARRFAESKLQASPHEHAAAENARSDYYLAFVRAREERLCGHDLVAACDEIADAIDDVRAGWKWAADTRREDTLGEAFCAFHRFCEIRGWFDEGAIAFEIPGCGNDRSLFCSRAMVFRAMCLSGAGRFAEARPIFRVGLRALRALGADRDMINPLKILGINVMNVGKRRAALRLLGTALRIGQAIGARHEMAGCFNALALAKRASGEFEDAERLFRQGRALRHEVGDRWGYGLIGVDLGLLLVERGRRDEARALLDEGRAIALELNNAYLLAAALNNLAELALAEGRLEDADALTAESLAHFRRDRRTAGIVACMDLFGSIAVARGDVRGAASYYQESLVLNAKIGSSAYLVDAALNIAALAAQCGRGPDARRILELIQSHSASSVTVLARARALLEELGKAGASPLDAESVGEVVRVAEAALQALSPSPA